MTQGTDEGGAPAEAVASRTKSGDGHGVDEGPVSFSMKEAFTLSESEIRKIFYKWTPYEFEWWVQTELGFHHVSACKTLGIDGFARTFQDSRIFLEVKQIDEVGPGAVDRFAGKIIRGSASRGILVGYSFSKGAFRAQRELNGIEVGLIGGQRHRPIKIELLTIFEAIRRWGEK